VKSYILPAFSQDVSYRYGVLEDAAATAWLE
jgi:hypothetical protein